MPVQTDKNDLATIQEVLEKVVIHTEKKLLIVSLGDFSKRGKTY